MCSSKGRGGTFREHRVSGLAAGQCKVQGKTGEEEAFPAGLYQSREGSEGLAENLNLIQSRKALSFWRRLSEHHTAAVPREGNPDTPENPAFWLQCYCHTWGLTLTPAWRHGAASLTPNEQRWVSVLQTVNATYFTSSPNPLAFLCLMSDSRGSYGPSLSSVTARSHKSVGPAMGVLCPF